VRVRLGTTDISEHVLRLPITVEYVDLSSQADVARLRER
jgi:hypothetical protein